MILGKMQTESIMLLFMISQPNIAQTNNKEGVMPEKKTDLTNEEIFELQNAIIMAVKGLKPEIFKKVPGFDPRVAGVDVNICHSKCFGTVLSPQELVSRKG